MSKETRKLAEVFSYLFVLSQRIEYITDCYLKKDSLTTKQLLTLIAIGNAFESDPSVSEVAEVLSTSHQNVTQIALNLQRRGFVEILKDPKDGRRKLLKLTEANDKFWEEREIENYENIKKIFSYLTKDELSELHRILSKSLIGIQPLYKEIRG
ncbi:MAG: MarR family winged helix-turn-helix transcriptional regulator [Candidatus Thorarchaeota archaeon]